MRILITGGAGFVGRHFTEYWLKQGADVDCVDIVAPLTGGIDPADGWPLFDPRDYNNFKFYKEDCFLKFCNYGRQSLSFIMIFEMFYIF